CFTVLSGDPPGAGALEPEDDEEGAGRAPGVRLRTHRPGTARLRPQGPPPPLRPGPGLPAGPRGEGAPDGAPASAAPRAAAKEAVRARFEAEKREWAALRRERRADRGEGGGAPGPPPRPQNPGGGPGPDPPPRAPRSGPASRSRSRQARGAAGEIGRASCREGVESAAAAGR